MNGNPIDWLAALFGIDVSILWRRLVQLVVIWLIGWIASRIVRLVARRIEAAVNDGNDAVLTAAEKRGQTIAQLIRSIGRVAILVGVTLLSLNLFVDIKPVLAGVGILSLAVSFGAQSLVKDLISGFFILFENQFAIGDVVEAGGKSGVVEKMTMRVVVLRDLKGVMHVIPNSEIKVVSNMTRGWSRAVVDVGVSYEENVDRALAVVRDEAAQFSTDKEWAPQLDGPVEVPGIESLGDSAIVIRCLIKTQPGSQWNAAREFRRRLKVRFDREEMEIPFPQRTVHVHVDDNAADRRISAAGAAGG